MRVSIGLIFASVLLLVLNSPVSAEFGELLYKLTASDAVVGDGFGSSVAINGNMAIVSKSSNSPGAYLIDLTTGQELRKLTVPAGGGQDTALNDSIAIVGRSTSGSIFTTVPGAALVFDIATGQELFQLTESPPIASGAFGVQVAINGDTAVVGAHSGERDPPDVGQGPPGRA
jgi:hypothetical protein